MFGDRFCAKPFGNSLKLPLPPDQITISALPVREQKWPEIEETHPVCNKLSIVEIEIKHIVYIELRQVSMYDILKLKCKM